MNLNNLTPDELLQLKAQLDGLTDTTGRTPFRPRQLHDLNRHPSAQEARPLFVWSADQPIDYRPATYAPYPALVWHQETGEERTIYSDGEREALGKSWQSIAPMTVVPDPMGDLQAAMDSLSPEDRQLVLQSQKQARMAQITERLAELTPDQLEALMVTAAPTKAKKTA